MTMHATVLRVEESSLLVRDHNTSQEVVVHTQRARCFRTGDRVRIWYSGAMTMSIPPQITAIKIMKIPPCGCRNNRRC